MPGAFEDRENTFEKQFVKDEALRFKATARRNKALALWIAELTGVSGAAAEKDADAFVGHNIGKSEDEVAAAVKDAFAAAKVEMSAHRIGKRMTDEMAAALASVRAGK